MITMDCVLEVFSAALLVIANVFCTSDSPSALPYLNSVNFSN